MMLPILISVSETPGSYFFCAAAGPSPVQTPSSMVASRMMHLCAISASLGYRRLFADLSVVPLGSLRFDLRASPADEEELPGAFGRTRVRCSVQELQIVTAGRLPCWYDV